jgi:hypothetical protein
LATRVLSFELFDALVDHVVIVQEDRVAANGHKMIIGANPDAAALVVYPRFFEKDMSFSREHALAHDIGELLFNQVNQAEYASYKADSAYALDGDYVEDTRRKLGDEDADREAFCETYADVITSKSAMETACRRYLRYSDPTRYQSLMATPEGAKQVDHLMQESFSLRSFLLHQQHALLPDLQDQAEERRSEGGTLPLHEENWLDRWLRQKDEEEMTRMAPPTMGAKPAYNKFMQGLFEFFDVK